MFLVMWLRTSLSDACGFFALYFNASEAPDITAIFTILSFAMLISYISSLKSLLWRNITNMPGTGFEPAQALSYKIS